MLYRQQDVNGWISHARAWECVSAGDVPTGVIVSGGNLWVTNYFISRIGKYDATTGATINGSFISGLNTPIGLALFGGNPFVVNNASEGPELWEQRW